MHLQTPWKSLSSLPISRIFTFPLVLAAALVWFAMPIAIVNAQDSWTDISGDKTVKAEFVKLEGVQLTLRKEDGKEIVLPLSKLDDKSRLKARAMAKNGGNSVSGSSSSSQDSTSPKTFAPVSFPSNSTAQEFMDIVMRELKNENPMVVWDALPASKQKQVQEIVKLATTRVEQRTVNVVKKFRADLLTALRSKKQFILNSRAIPLPPGFAKSYDPIVSLIEAVLPNEWMDVSYLQQADVRDLLNGYVGNVVLKTKEVEKTVPSDSPFKSMLNQTPTEATVKSVSSTEAMIELIGPGQPEAPAKFVLSEGRWLPEELLTNWDKSMAQAKLVLDQANPKEIHQRVVQAITLANGSLGAFSLVETQEDFDNVIGQLGPMISGLAGGMAPGAGGPGVPFGR